MCVCDVSASVLSLSSVDFGHRLTDLLVHPLFLEIVIPALCLDTYNSTALLHRGLVTWSGNLARVASWSGELGES